MTNKRNMEDYLGKDGLLYCGNCHDPKEAYYPENFRRHGLIKHPQLCRCQVEELEREEACRRQQEHEANVTRLRSNCFAAGAMKEMTFENASPWTAPLEHARQYVTNWKEFLRNNTGLLLWGDFGTGKTYAAACIANALLEQEVSVRMTSFPQIANELYGCEDKKEYLHSLCSVSLLIIDDFGVERQNEYMLEIIWSVLEMRSAICKPLIVTTNLTLDELHNPPDDNRQRIYDRILAQCPPLMAVGENLRIGQEAKQLKQLEKLMK